jgi:hypothetical protein
VASGKWQVASGKCVAAQSARNARETELGSAESDLRNRTVMNVKFWKFYFTEQ